MHLNVESIMRRGVAALTPCLLVAAVNLIVPAPVHAAWVRQSPLPTHRDLQGFDFIDGSNGWFIANDGPDHGSIWHSPDGGASWTEQFVDVVNRLEDIDMIDAQNGWAIGAALVQTTNGGQTWTDANRPAQGVTGNYIQFVSPTRGWLSTRPATAKNYLYRTTNAGQVWDFLGEFWVGSWMFADANVGWAIDKTQQVVRTSDGGDNWTIIGDPSGISIDSAIYRVFSQDRVMVRTYDSAYLLRWWITEDGGQSWTEVVGNAGNSPVFVDAQHGYSVYRYDVMGTTDAGYTWAPVATNVGAKVLTALAVNGNGLLAGGWYGFLTQFDGSSWSQVSNGTGQLLRDVSFGDSQTGWAVGDDFGLLRTTNAGTTWSHVFLPGVRRDIWEVHAFSPTCAYAEAATGHFVTSDGITWQEAAWWPSGLAYFSDCSRGWILKGSNTLYKTTDGGATWVSRTASGITGYDVLHDMKFVDDTIGYIAARWELIFKTTNGGTSWTSLPHPATPGLDYRHVGFANATRGWVTGSFGTILRTTDGGASWINQSLPEQRDVLDLEVMGPNEAYVCGGATGGYGYVRHTTDGVNWASFFVNNSSIQYGVTAQPGHVWTCGYDGGIDHLATGTASTPDLPPGAARALLSAYPNPAREGVSVVFDLDHTTTAVATVIDAGGRAIRTFPSRQLDAGIQRLDWDGTDDKGSDVSSGRYFMRVAWEDRVESIPFMIIH